MHLDQFDGWVWHAVKYGQRQLLELFLNWTVLPIVALLFYLLIAFSVPWREEILSICEIFMSYKTYNDTK